MKRDFYISIIALLSIEVLVSPYCFAESGEGPQYTGKNYIVEVTPTMPCTNVNISSESNISYSDNGTGIIAIQYFDGLYRASQSSVWDASHEKYLTTQTTYDAAGREHRKWLPVPNTRGGGYIEDYDSHAVSLYGTNPYDEIVWEQSPLNRDLGTKGPHEYYSHGSTISYLLNAADEVKRFAVASDGVRKTGTYPKGTLHKKYHSDPDGKHITEYTDAFDRVIMQRTASSADTYYVYNDLGQLAYVIPPLLADKLTNNTTYADTCTDMRRLAYVYKYDTRGNVASKRLPGCDPVYQVYDKGNRLVLTQDGNQRQRGHYWTVTKYDAINRPIYSFEVLAGECSSLAAAQQLCEPLNFIEIYSPQGEPEHPIDNSGYSRTLFHNHAYTLLVMYYYDDYTFLNHLSSSVAANLTAQSVNGYDAVTSGSVKGMLTGQRIYDTQGLFYTTTAFYYDKRGRLVQDRSFREFLGLEYYTGYTYHALTFTGKPLKTMTQETFSGTTTSERYEYRYDSQERLLATRYQLNNDAPIQLDSFKYDDLGRVSRKYMLDKIDSVSYTYNIRNQITKLKSSGFEENLYYTTSPVSSWPTDACYNGNVSINTWTYGNKTNGYMYFYDGYNRMSSNYSILDGEWGDAYYSESFSYDKQGNVQMLYRWNDEQELNWLSMSYEGNQLVKVTDDAYDPMDYSAKRYQDGENAQKEMFYDKNGALIADFDRKICAIQNNLLTLPDTIQFSNGNQIVHIYDAMGNRLRTTYYTRKVALVEPATNTIPGTDNLQEYNIVSYTMLGNKRYVRYNHGSWALEYVYNPEGYIKYWGEEEHYPYYYIKDHLGSVRETYIRPYPTEKYCEQRMQYYPSGLPWNTNLNASYQPFKYNSKEFVEMHGLDEYDSQARWYYPAIMRTTTMDPLCEKYYSISPYAWCHNNPASYVDPDGRDDYFDQNGKFQYRDDKKTDYVMVQLDNGKYQNLAEFDYSTECSQNRAMLSNVASYYAQQVGLNQIIDICDKDIEGAMAATDEVSDFPQVYIIVTNGKLSPNAGTSNNLMNTFVHEEDHVEKRNKNSMAEVSAIIRQMNHPTWKNTTEIYKTGIIGYLLENANKAILGKENSYEHIVSMIEPLGLPIFFFNNEFSLIINEIEIGGIKIK